jgi:hypothetical protein
LPFNDYFEYFSPDFKLHPDLPSAYDNQNTRQYLETAKARVLEILRSLQGAPSVQMHEVRALHAAAACPPPLPFFLTRTRVAVACDFRVIWPAIAFRWLEFAFF